MRRLILLSILLVLFFGYDVLLFIGYLGDNVTFLQKIHPSVYLLLFAFLTIPKKTATIRQEVVCMLFIVVLYYTVTYFGGEIDSTFLINSFILPVLFSAVIISYKPKKREISQDLKNIIIYFFIIECSIAIFEAIFKINLIWVKTESLQDVTNIAEFRSSALLGHPLQNALCVSSIMTFILVSNVRYKYLLWSLGFLAILCFNTRSSIVASGILLVIYAVYVLFANNKIKLKEKRSVIFYLIVGSISMIYLMVEYSLGGRLLKMGLFDQSSAVVRVDILQVFDYFELKTFLIGLSKSQSERILHGSGMDDLIIENYLISFILNFGIIFTIMIVIFFGAFVKGIIINYSKFSKYFIVGGFFVISLTNNSLATNTLDFTIFIICCYAFMPKLNSQNYAQSA